MVEESRIRPFTVVNDASPVPEETNGQQDFEPTGESESVVTSSTSVKARPSRPLPTDRIKFPRQLDALRAFAVASGPQTRPVSLQEVAPLISMTPNTVSLATTFFVDAGLLTRTETGRFLPTPVTQDFARAYDWNKDTAAHKLAPALAETWFAEELLKWINVRGSISEKDAAETLAGSVSASPHYKAQIRLLIDFLEAAGLVDKDGQSIRQSRREVRDAAPLSEAAVTPPSAAQSEPEIRRHVVATSASQSPEGVVAFSVAIRVDMTELATWSPDRIGAFFAGLAKVIAAKNGVENNLIE